MSCQYANFVVKVDITATRFSVKVSEELLFGPQQKKITLVNFSSLNYFAAKAL